MIAQLVLDHWKSHAHSTLYIDPLTVLIGANASGKSNALDALLFLNRIAQGVSLTSALQGDGTQPPMRGGIEWAAQRPGKAFGLSVVIQADECLDYEYTIEASTQANRCELLAEKLVRIKYRTDKLGRRASEAGRINLFWTDPVDEGSPDSPSITACLYNEKRGSPRPLGRSHAILYQLGGQQPRAEIEEGISHALKALRNVFMLDPIPAHMRGYAQLSERLNTDGGNIAGVLAALPEPDKQRVEQTLTHYARELPEKDIRRVYAEAVGKFQSDAMLYCDEHWSDEEEDTTVDARGMSDGSLRFLAILTALLTRPRGSLLVIEEVDNGLHPSRAQLLLGMLQKVGADRSVDILATTHNPALLDAMDTEMVPFITVAHRDHKHGGSRLSLLEDLDELPKLLAQGRVGTLSSAGLIERSLHDARSPSKEPA
ncbi:MAG: AAA family ATPase [Lautropia sp.]|nr:AAA family ATPase [Lautropia sp.]